MRNSTIIVLLAIALYLPVQSKSQQQIRIGARINNLKVLSSNIDDVTTPETILKSFVKPGMTDAERAKALWTAAIKYRHQCAPPTEEISGDWEAHDPVKIFNVYGYCMCCCASSLIESLNRLDGREARGRILNGHSDKDLIRMSLSYDGGKSSTEAARIEGPTPGVTRYFKASSIPAHVRKALLRYELTGNNTVGIFSFRVDADYMDPIAAFFVQPFTVTHRWRENGREMSKKTEITRLPFSYSIHADTDPEMVSVTYETASLQR